MARSPSSVLRQASTTFIPARASASTLGTPIPLLPPVQTATPPSGTYDASISALLISRSTSLAVDFLPRSRSAAAAALVGEATAEKELTTSVAMPRSKPSVRSGCEYFMISMYCVGFLLYYYAFSSTPGHHRLIQAIVVVRQHQVIIVSFKPRHDVAREVLLLFVSFPHDAPHTTL